MIGDKQQNPMTNPLMEAGVKEYGVFATYQKRNCASDLIFALYNLQHRGQKYLGIHTLLRGDNRIGTINEAFHDDVTLNNLLKNYYNSDVGVAFVGGGRYKEGFIKKVKEKDVDAEIEDFYTSIKPPHVFFTEDSAYVLPDARGVWRLYLGKNKYGYALASESCTFLSDLKKYEGRMDLLRDVMPGEMIVLRKESNGKIDMYSEIKKRDIPLCCIQDLIHHSRPDSIICKSEGKNDGKSIYSIREKEGKILPPFDDVEIVTAVPEAALPLAFGYSDYHKLPYANAIITGRFDKNIKKISVGSSEMIRRARFNLIKGIVEGKKIGLIDDIAITANTLKHVVNEAKRLGAKSVEVRVLHTMRTDCPYEGCGKRDDFIANRMSKEEIGEFIGADSFDYPEIREIERAIKEAIGNTCEVCTLCLTG